MHSDVVCWQKARTRLRVPRATGERRRQGEGRRWVTEMRQTMPAVPAARTIRRMSTQNHHRRLRVQYPNALYHMTSRGVERGNIYLDDDDRGAFFDLSS